MLYRCPNCAGGLIDRSDALVCSTCARRYPITEGIPVFVKEDLAQHDELDHLSGGSRDAPAAAHDHKAEQSAYFGRGQLAEFETERPYGSPALYRFFLTEKFRRSIEPLGGRLDGLTALAVCGGSGMDAEFLARAGASVVSSDISLGAAARVRERSQRHRVPITPIVADVERLPFEDRSFDVVYVHDGLHHLEDPAAGMREMTRVAKLAVCITEPARAAATSIAVRFGLALEREEAGNRVARLEESRARGELERAGFSVVRSERYAMYYNHVPGRIITVLSKRPALPTVIAGWRLANRLLGRFGNKLTVVATRR